MRAVLPAATLLAAGLLAACQRGDSGPGTLDADDQRQLNEAAEMLDANSVSANALPATAE